MKIAVLLYGRLKFFREHYESIKINFPDCDIYYSGSNELEINEFVKLYKPIKYDNSAIIEKELEEFLNKSKKYSETNISNMVKHFINKKRVFSLIESEYDVYVVTRIDLVYKDKIKLERNDMLNIPNGEDYRRGLNDQFAYGNKYVIDKYCSLIDNIINYINGGVFAHPETLNRVNVDAYKIPLKRFNLNYRIRR